MEDEKAREMIYPRVMRIADGRKREEAKRVPGIFVFGKAWAHWQAEASARASRKWGAKGKNWQRRRERGLDGLAID
jgi:hypothetical protein